MGFWSNIFSTSDPETGEKTSAKVKADDKGHVSDIIYGIEKDSSGGKHGHVWGLNAGYDQDDKIGGRDSKSAK